MAIAQRKHPENEKDGEYLVLEVELSEESLYLFVEELKVDEHGREEAEADDNVVGNCDCSALLKVVEQQVLDVLGLAQVVHQQLRSVSCYHTNRQAADNPVPIARLHCQNGDYQHRSSDHSVQKASQRCYCADRHLAYKYNRHKPIQFKLQSKIFCL